MECGRGLNGSQGDGRQGNWGSSPPDNSRLPFFSFVSSSSSLYSLFRCQARSVRPRPEPSLKAHRPHTCIVHMDAYPPRSVTASSTATAMGGGMYRVAVVICPRHPRLIKPTATAGTRVRCHRRTYISKQYPYSCLHLHLYLYLCPDLDLDLIPEMDPSV